MKIKMNIKEKSSLYLSIIFLVTLASCSEKDNFGMVSALSEKSVSIYTPNQTDTLGFSVSVAKDSIKILHFSAVVSEKISSGKHNVKFRVDSTKMTLFNSKYGKASLLPAANYFIFNNVAKLSSDSLKSTDARINVITTSYLAPLTTYVLPVVIESIDGNTEAVNPSANTLFLIVHTGKSPFIDKTPWKITEFSSEYAADYSPAAAIDKDMSTYWFSDDIEGMPQYFTVDMGSIYQLTSIIYSNYNINYGGYPTQMNIQTSVDGITWNDQGNFTGDAVASQSLDFEATPSRYFKFTVLEIVPFFDFNSVALTDIKAKLKE